MAPKNSVYKGENYKEADLICYSGGGSNPINVCTDFSEHS